MEHYNQSCEVDCRRSLEEMRKEWLLCQTGIVDLLRTPYQKTIFVPEQLIWLKSSGDMCPVLDSTQSKFKRKILRCSRVILRLRVKKVGDFFSRSNSKDFGLMSKCSQHLPLQLNRARFLKILFVYFFWSSFGKIGKMRANFSDFFFFLNQWNRK